MHVLQLPVKAYFGTNAVAQGEALLAKCGTKALLVTGRQSARLSGAQADVVAVLERLEIDYVVFNEIEENPSVETVKRAAVYGLEAGADFIIGIGGGSPLDASKAIAMIMRNPELVKTNIFGLKPMKALPVIAIPTTSGTGSEVTQYAVLTDHMDQTKKNLGQSIFPKAAFLDPKYTYSLSPNVTRQTAVDAFTHLAEGYLNKNANPLSDGLAIQGLKMLGKHLASLELDEFSEEVRSDLMYASMLAGMVIAHTGTSLPHGMGYALTYHHGLPHGVANGILFNAYLTHFKDQTRVKELLSALGLEDLNELNQHLKRLCPCDLSLSDAVLQSYADQMAQNEGKLKNHPEPMDAKTLYTIYRESIA